MKEDKKGKFYEALKRNSSAIKNDEVEVLYEEAQIKYKRRIENIEFDIKRLKSSQKTILHKLTDTEERKPLGERISINSFINEDFGIVAKLEDLNLTLDLMKERYSALFE